MATAEKQEVEEQTLQLLENEEGKRLFVRFLLEGLDQDALALLAKRLLGAREYTASDKDAEFARRIGVRNYATEERMALEIASLMHYFDYRKRLLANSLSAPRVAEMLGTSRQTPHDRVQAGLLLAILDNNVWKFPDWQFDPEGANGVVEGLPEVLAALQCGTFAKIKWLASPSPIFDELRPIDALKMGRMAEVVHEAQAVGVH